MQLIYSLNTRIKWAELTLIQALLRKSKLAFVLSLLTYKSLIIFLRIVCKQDLKIIYSKFRFKRTWKEKDEKIFFLNTYLRK